MILIEVRDADINLLYNSEVGFLLLKGNSIKSNQSKLAYVDKDFDIEVPKLMLMADEDDNSNRRRVSARFILVYFIILVFLFFVLLSFADAVKHHHVSSGTISGLVFTVIFGSIIWYIVMTLKIIEYDDLKCILYVSD